MLRETGVGERGRATNRKREKESLREIDREIEKEI